MPKDKTPTRGRCNLSHHVFIRHFFSDLYTLSNSAKLPIISLIRITVFARMGVALKLET
uniref:Uncharacterized protein n=1 Tax=Rhizophora mucronata TaxID=61149 RepID=A0A2P2JX35_RHIMU